MKSSIQRPLDDYDISAWQTYYAANPGFLRSVGADGDKGEDDEGDGGEGEGESASQIGDISKAVAAEVAKAMGPIVESLSALQQSMKPPAGDGEEEDDSDDRGGDPDDAPDYDLMTNKELVSHFRKEMVSMGRAFASELEKMRSSGEKTAAQVEAERMGDKYDDFWDMRDKIAEEIKGNMHLTMEQAYKLAKVNNPDKVKEIKEAKAKASGDQKDLKKEKEEEEERQRMPFGGLLPTSGKSRPNTAMKPEQAAESAWQTVFGAADSNTARH